MPNTKLLLVGALVLSVLAMVAITNEPIPASAAPPSCGDASATIPMDSIAVVITLPGCTDPDPGEIVFCAPATLPANGVGIVDPLCVNAVYTPTPGFCGADSFTYQGSDTEVPPSSDTGTVTVNVVKAAAPDVDCDGTTDADDDCLTVANAAQTNTDADLVAAGARIVIGNPPPPLSGDGLGDACDSDDDNDGFLDTRELAVGTDPYDNCLNDPPDSGQGATKAWLPDLRGTDNIINGTDFNPILANWQQNVPPAPVGADLFPDGKINGSDFNPILAKWQSRCQ